MASVAGAMFFGDAVCQRIEQGREHCEPGPVDGRTLSTPEDICFRVSDAYVWNASRSMRMGITGFVVSGPISQSTYVLAAKYLSHLSTAPRVAIIAGVAPINITASMATPPLLCGHTVDMVIDKCRRDVPPTFALNSLYWPAALWFNVTRVRLVNQASVGSIFWFGWSVILSLYVNRR